MRMNKEIWTLAAGQSEKTGLFFRCQQSLIDVSLSILLTHPIAIWLAPLRSTAIGLRDMTEAERSPELDI